MCHHRLFHFTTKEGADAIRSSKILKQSQDTLFDTVTGKGVYFTKKSPWHHSKVDIVMNNWGASRKAAEQWVARGRVDYVVMVHRNIIEHTMFKVIRLIVN
jgi:hypothetical protein